ncbi:NS4 [Bluetongue virus 16]|uniref:NS4 n=7 Tax=Bluetongue virus TaxID=40051 RepID=A0A2H4KNB8_BTV|nr:NS4 [Bluetongue virus 7]AFK91801.1 NS4 [Bluetongue virus 16]ASW41658.1 NS4 [Bluetongue virus]QOL11085.1 non-structural protein-4 [Bluetongue virus 3]QPA19104.1 non-structural protein-4 [Bluetongue virus 21]QPA19137.1 non-structural protein-4 [Bluetongue virus 15]QPH37540.1 non-structural protein-4 [Bluetongue virus 4]
MVRGHNRRMARRKRAAKKLKMQMWIDAYILQWDLDQAQKDLENARTRMLTEEMQRLEEEVEMLMRELELLERAEEDG